MVKLITLTPNPALDVSGHVAHILPNEKNYVFRQRRDPGGNGINAARISSRLGVPTVALGFLGGAEGKEIETLLHAEKVRCYFTPIKNASRINITVTNDSDHKQTRLTFPGPKVAPTEIKNLMHKLNSIKASGIFILGGSLPPGCPENFHLKTTTLAQTNNQGVIADLPARFLKKLLVPNRQSLLMLKPNEVELEELVGRKLVSETQLISEARKLTRYAALVCVSRGSKGALLVTKTGEWRGHAPKIKALGSVGAGDSMVGAMAARLVCSRITSPSQINELLSMSQNQLPAPLEDAFRWGLAAGAATAQVEGTALASAKQIKALVSRIEIKQIKG